MPTMVSVIRMAGQLTDAILEQCGLWREHGWEWWPLVHDQAPEGFEWSVPPPPQRPVRPILAQDHLGQFWWEVRAEDPAVTGFSWSGRGVPKPLPHRGPHLLAVLHRSCPPGSPRRLLVAIGLDGMPQDDRRKWRNLLKVVGESSDDRPPHVSWINAFRNSQPQHHTPLAGAIPDAQRRQGVRQLYVGRRRALWTHRDVMGQLLIYAYQAEMVSREDMTPWLEGYIRDSLPRVSLDDLWLFLEEVLKTFARPLDANGLRAHLRHRWQTEQRAGGIDRRLVRGVEVVDTARNPYEVEADTHDQDPRRGGHHRAAANAEAVSVDGGPLTLSLSQTAGRLGLTPRQLGYLINQGKICAIRRGRYWRFSVAEVARWQRRRKFEDLKAALIVLRYRERGGKLDTARRWVERACKRGLVPQKVYEVLAVNSRAQDEPELLTRIRELIEGLGPDTGWEA